MNKKNFGKDALTRLVKDIAEADDLIRFEQSIEDYRSGKRKPILPVLSRDKIAERFFRLGTDAGPIGKTTPESIMEAGARIRAALIAALGEAYATARFYSSVLLSVERKDFARAGSQETRLVVNLEEYLGGNISMDISPNRDAMVSGNFRQPEVLVVCLINFSRGCQLVGMKDHTGKEETLLDVESRASRKVRLGKNDVNLAEDDLALVVLKPTAQK